MVSTMSLLDTMMNERKKIGLSLLLFMSLAISQAFAVPPSSWSTEEIAGIWRLSRNEEEACLIRLKEDMTFSKYDEVNSESIQGVWDYRKDNTLVLALDDNMLLEGKLSAHETESMVDDPSLRDQVELHLSVGGKVQKGTFLYPRSHPSYFELYHPKLFGMFTLRQVLGKLFVRPKEQSSREQRFSMSDFHGKRFWLAVAPVRSKLEKSYSEQNVVGSLEDIIQQVAVDIRLYPIEFFANNTFCATGSNKILRGRYGVSGEDQLWFQVSLFGSGRSVSGSVYSEGTGLSHEDKRAYFGIIVRDSERLQVDGSVVIGTDLGSDARPEPVASFSLKERTYEQDFNSFSQGGFE